MKSARSFNTLTALQFTAKSGRHKKWQDIDLCTTCNKHFTGKILISNLTTV